MSKSHEMEANLFNLGGLNFSGLKVEVNLRSGKGATANSTLALPLRGLPAAPSILACLSWHTRSSKFVGRSEELRALLEWCEHPTPLSLRFVHGPGGVGKSRLAAELTLLLRQRKWSAGFLNSIDQEAALHVPAKGTLIIIDYPEENPELLSGFLKRLRDVEPHSTMRVLCLSRELPRDWATMSASSGVADFFDTRSITLTGVAEQDAYRLFSSAAEEISEALDTCPRPVSQAAFEEWYGASPFHSNPLFLVAAASHSAFSPDDHILSYTGADSIIALVRKEHERLRRIAAGRNLPEQSFIEIAATAILQDGIAQDAVSQLAAALPVHLELTPDDESLQAISRTDDSDLIQFDMPDVLAAVFLAKALEGSAAPGDLLWVATTVRPAPLERFARLASDAQLVLGEGGRAILNAAIANLEDTERFRSYLHGVGLRRERSLDPVLWPLWTAIHLRFSETASETLLIASALINASVGLSNQGNHAEALPNLRRAREMLARSKCDRQLKYQETANILLNMGRAYASTGKPQRAIRELEESIVYAKKAAKTASDGFGSRAYWEAQDTIALASDNIARAQNLLGRPKLGIIAAERAWALTQEVQAAQRRKPSWAESNILINFAIACLLANQFDRAQALLESCEADLRRRPSGERLEFQLTLTLSHHVAVTIARSAVEQVSIKTWEAAMTKIEEAIVGADRLLAASPNNMIKLAVNSRLMRAQIFYNLGEIDGWLVTTAEVHRLMRRYRPELQACEILPERVAAIAREKLGEEEGHLQFLAAFQPVESAEAAWLKSLDIDPAPFEDPARAIRDIWPDDADKPWFVTL